MWKKDWITINRGVVMKIQIKNLCKSFKDNQVLNNVSLDIDDQEIVVLMGLSGSGKTTLLRCLCDLETADSGEIIINGNLLIDFRKHPKEKIDEVFC